MVWSASWSPVDDRVAYCEYGNVITIISLDGEVLARRENVLWDFTWSPDGSAIALGYSGPDMVDLDGLRFAALAVWWLEKDALQLLSDAKFNLDAYPIWSMDKRVILFHRIFSEKSEEEGNGGFYIVDVSTGKTTYLRNSPEIYPWYVSRSPRSDTLLISLGKRICVMKFDGTYEVIGEGLSPAWLPDGKTIVYMPTEDEFTSHQVDLDLADQSIGGRNYSQFANLKFDYNFFSEKR